MMASLFSFRSYENERAPMRGSFHMKILSREALDQTVDFIIITLADQGDEQLIPFNLVDDAVFPGFDAPPWRVTLELDALQRLRVFGQFLDTPRNLPGLFDGDFSERLVSAF